MPSWKNKISQLENYLFISNWEIFGAQSGAF